MAKRKSLQLICPIYNGANYIEKFYQNSLEILAEQFELKFIFIDDGSSDKSWALLEKICRKDKKSAALKLSRNFGQNRAIYAGFQHAQADYVLAVDVDLQDNLNDIAAMVALSEEGYDIVKTIRSSNPSGLLRRLLTPLFYLLTRYQSDAPLSYSANHFKLLNHKALSIYQQMNINEPYLEAEINYLGLRSATMQTRRLKKNDSGSSYTLKKLAVLGLKYFLNFSSLPFAILAFLGIATSLGAVVALILLTFDKLEASLAQLILIFLAGVIILGQGITGFYLRTMQKNQKAWPVYLISEALNIKAK